MTTPDLSTIRAFIEAVASTHPSTLHPIGSRIHHLNGAWSRTYQSPDGEKTTTIAWLSPDGSFDRETA